MRIGLRITVDGIDRIMERVNRLAQVHDRSAEIARRLCVEVGEPLIWAWHGNHARVFTEPTANGYSIVAEGEQVLFIEFGTGNAAGIYAQHYNGTVPAIVRPKSWSEQDAHMYEVLGFWIWHGHWFEETPPHPAFYDAYRAMLEAYPRIAREVLGNEVHE